LAAGALGDDVAVDSLWQLQEQLHTLQEQLLDGWQGEHAG
jgi:hypothetical protein